MVIRFQVVSGMEGCRIVSAIRTMLAMQALFRENIVMDQRFHQTKNTLIIGTYAYNSPAENAAMRPTFRARGTCKCQMDGSGSTRI